MPSSCKSAVTNRLATNASSSACIAASKLGAINEPPYGVARFVHRDEPKEPRDHLVTCSMIYRHGVVQSGISLTYQCALNSAELFITSCGKPSTAREVFPQAGQSERQER